MRAAALGIGPKPYFRCLVWRLDKALVAVARDYRDWPWKASIEGVDDKDRPGRSTRKALVPHKILPRIGENEGFRCQMWYDAYDAMGHG